MDRSDREVKSVSIFTCVQTIIQTPNIDWYQIAQLITYIIEFKDEGWRTELIYRCIIEVNSGSYHKLSSLNIQGLYESVYLVNGAWSKKFNAHIHIGFTKPPQKVTFRRSPQ